MEIPSRSRDLLHGVRTGRGCKRCDCERGISSRHAVVAGGAYGFVVLVGMELWRNVDDNVAAGAALERTACAAADQGRAGRGRRRRRRAGENSLKTATDDQGRTSKTRMISWSAPAFLA